MFGRSNPTDSGAPKPMTLPATAPAQGLPVASGPAPSRPSPFGAAQTMTSSIIGTDLTILGEKITIISQQKLQIDGDVRGDINGRQVVIGEEGSVIGTICAENIEVKGGVRGAIKATSVTLHPTAEVEGDIMHMTLAISEGAQFDGRVRRAKDNAELKPNLDVGSFATAPPPAST